VVTPTMPSKPATYSGPRGATAHADIVRGSAYARGYDARWQKISRLYRNQHPMCEQCERQGRETLAECTDHITPFHGVHDPLRLLWSNLQSLCWECHSRKTVEQDGGLGHRKAKHNSGTQRDEMTLPGTQRDITHSTPYVPPAGVRDASTTRNASRDTCVCQRAFYAASGPSCAASLSAQPHPHATDF
jgi:5-methylcytosine-specific restriction enzyme A